MEIIIAICCMFLIVLFVNYNIYVRIPKEIKKEMTGAKVRCIIRDYFMSQMDDALNKNEIYDILKYNGEIQALLEEHFGME